MPQLDKATFFPVLFWSLVLYVGGYLLLNTSDLFTFLSAFKFKKLSHYDKHVFNSGPYLFVKHSFAGHVFLPGRELYDQPVTLHLLLTNSLTESLMLDVISRTNSIDPLEQFEVTRLTAFASTYATSLTAVFSKRTHARFFHIGSHLRAFHSTKVLNAPPPFHSGMLDPAYLQALTQKYKQAHALERVCTNGASVHTWRTRKAINNLEETHLKDVRLDYANGRHLPLNQYWTRVNALQLSTFDSRLRTGMYVSALAPLRKRTDEVVEEILMINDHILKAPVEKPHVRTFHADVVENLSTLDDLRIQFDQLTLQTSASELSVYRSLQNCHGRPILPQYPFKPYKPTESIQVPRYTHFRFPPGLPRPGVETQREAEDMNEKESDSEENEAVSVPTTTDSPNQGKVEEETKPSPLFAPRGSIAALFATFKSFFASCDLHLLEPSDGIGLVLTYSGSSFSLAVALCLIAFPLQVYIFFSFDVPGRLRSFFNKFISRR